MNSTRSKNVSSASPFECWAQWKCEDRELETRDNGGEDRPSPNDLSALDDFHLNEVLRPT